ncbi:unnamed protein product [Cyprideis torosa]|uniref:F-actin-capping protein subunit alpha n=1 Tax=Cyprideis torosa TaxID=163714 RepID=A0A7R8ZP73_9CRUS|nr:unnamed protein product [Cyprideis torosa]CAG0887872.1 unnamed protein product [Cyprideis torosa]
MVKSCSAFVCTERNTEGTEVHFFRFPFGDPARLENWVKALRRENFTPVRGSSVLCSKHISSSYIIVRIGKSIVSCRDVRVILNNDALLREGASQAVAAYNKRQLTPVKMEDGSYSLITEFNDLGGGRFVDPRSKTTFRYDHLRKEASDYQHWNPDPLSESWRQALEHQFRAYGSDHYKNGHCAVFSKSEGSTVILTACIEDHQFQSQNFWNGRWRSIWTTSFDPHGTGNAVLKGHLMIQVHYYEDGNVQLQANKEIKENLVVGSESATAKDFVHTVERAENDCHSAIAGSYQKLCETTFKALRRQLPVTRTKIEWANLASYSIGKQLRNQ